MKHRIAVIAALLVALGAVYGVSTTAAQAAATLPQSATTPYTIHSVIPGSHVGGLGCIADPGHGNLVYVRFTCTTTFNLVYQETTAGFAWYLLRYNGTNDCLNYDPDNGFIYDDSCIRNDPSEMWEHHSGDLLVSLANESRPLTICNNTGNARLFASPLVPPGCHVTSFAQLNWEFIEE